MALLEGMFIDPRSQRLADEIVRFYQQTAPLTCAVENRGGNPPSTRSVRWCMGTSARPAHNVAADYREFRENGQGDVPRRKPPSPVSAARRICF